MNGQTRNSAACSACAHPPQPLRADPVGRPAEGNRAEERRHAGDGQTEPDLGRAEPDDLREEHRVLPVRNAPSPAAESTDCSDSLRARGVGGRKRSRRDGTAVLPSRPVSLGRANNAVRALDAWLAAEAPDPWVVETSGSTGAPKRVVLPRAAVLASVGASARRLGAQGGGCWPCRRRTSRGSSGRVPLAGRRPRPRAAQDHDGFAAATEALGLGRPLRLAGAGTQPHRLLETDTVSLPAPSTPCCSAAGRFHPALRERAAAASMSSRPTARRSTAGGCVYDGLPLDGVAVAIGDDGRVRVGGPTLFAGYDGDPALTAEVLVDGWFLTSDAGRLDEDGRLQALGRIDDVVVTGGVNVPAPRGRRAAARAPGRRGR